MKKVLILLGVVALLAAAWFWGLPAYRAHKERKFAALARTHFEKGEQRAALLCAQQALVLNSSNRTACEIMAELADNGRSPTAVIWRRRVADAAPSISNFVVLASCALRYEQPPFTLAQEALASAAKAGQPESYVPFQVVSAQLAIKQGRIPDAEKFFQQAIRLEPTNGLHRLNLATVRLESRDAEVSKAAHAELVAMQSDALLGGHASRALAAHHAARKDFDSALKYSSALVQRADVTFDNRLDHLTLLYQAKRPEFDSYAAELEKIASTNAVLVFAVTGRLLACDEADKALAWLKSLPATMQSEQPVSLAFADTYSRLKDWRTMEDRLNKENWNEMEFMRAAMLAFAVRNQKDETVAKVHWSKALQLASEHPERFAVLAQLANGWHWETEAEDVLWRVAKNFPREGWALDSLNNGYMRRADTRGLFSVYATLLEHGATNGLVMNNYASLALLLGTNVARAHQIAHEVYLKGTNNPAFVSTYAWSLFLQGKTADALKMIEQIPPERLAEPSMAAYYGTILAANGQKEKARAFLERTQTGPVLPEEKALAEATKSKL
jgi:tetratricopeptide (TPR) repeat protein